MYHPYLRPRRLRVSEGLRAMVRETVLHVEDLVYPLFLVPGEKIKKEIPSLPGQYHLSVDQAVLLAQEAWKLGIRSVLLFGLPSYKDEQGSSAWDLQQPVQQAMTAIKKALPETSPDWAVSPAT